MKLVFNPFTGKLDFVDTGGSGTDGILSLTENVDLTTVGTVNLYTVPSGKIAIVTGAIIRPVTAVSVSDFAEVGIGIASGEDDIMSSTVLTGLDSVGKLYQFKAIGVNVIGNATDIIKIGVDTNL